MATATKKRSPLQAPVTDRAVYVLPKRDGSLAPEEKTSYLTREYLEYVNAEGTVGVVCGYRRHSIILKTDLAIEDVVEADAEILTSEEDYYVRLRANGVWAYLVEDHYSSKTSARQAAAALVERIQDIQHPLNVALDGKHAPALTIALAKVEKESDYRKDDTRVREVSDLAQETGVDNRLLALAIKEDRLVWSTPPVAPALVTVVVYETATGNLSERLVDEVVLATREVEGLGRIVHKGSIPEYLLSRRTFQQRRSVEAILNQREALQKALREVQRKSQSLLDDLDKGQVVGRGFHDTLNLGREVEQAQAAATAYASEVTNADLPQAFLQGLLKNEYADPDDSRWIGATIRSSMKALSAINGMPVREDDVYF